MELVTIKKDHKHHDLGMYQEKGWPLLMWNPTLQTVTPSWAIVLLVLSVSLNGQSLILHSYSVAGVKTWRGLRSHKTSASGWVSGLRWYISPNKEVVRRYCHTKYHSGECHCSLVVCSILLALCSDTCRLDLNSLTLCSRWFCGHWWTRFLHTQVEESNSSEIPSPFPHTLSEDVQVQH